MIKGLKRLAVLSVIGSIALSGCGKDKGDPNGSEKTKSFTIGVTQIVEHPSLDAAFNGFKKALEDQGVQADYDVQIAQGDQNNNQMIANNFVGDSVDLIFANSTPSALGALNATKDIPIVFTSVTDAVGTGLVESMEKPGGNVTGTTDTHPDAIPNLVKFIQKYFPNSKVGVIYNSGEQNSVAQIDLVKKEMKKANVRLEEATVSTSSEVKQAAESLIGKVDVFYIITDNTVVSALESVIQVANEGDVPLFVGELDSVKRGGFAAYGFDYFDIGYEAGEMAAKVLTEGKKPSELPVQYPQKLKLQLNKKAAEEMNIQWKEEWNNLGETIK
ncbi:ABC transporter substrate-binding protein [Bacillus sp. CGMCC 1.16607]|uniref:ABC transporter substrate-binding protein n=1 Tax=Bacillus sp. CGMCC 1.16607 TaxID=3351842 RepID=UPI0036381EB8